MTARQFEPREGAMFAFRGPVDRAIIDRVTQESPAS